MYVLDSDLDTNNSSFQEFEDSEANNKINEGMVLLEKFQNRLIKRGFYQILGEFSQFHPELAENFVRKAEKNMENQNYKQAQQCANLALKCLQNDKNNLFQRALLILLQSKIFYNQIRESKEIFGQILQLKHIFNSKKLTILKIKLYKLIGNTSKLLQSLNEVQNDESLSISQKTKLIIFCSESLIELNFIEEVFQQLQNWLPYIINNRYTQNLEISKVYLLLGAIQKRRKNLQKQYHQLYCASLTVQVGSFDQNFYLFIQCCKIENLIERQLIPKAVHEIENIFQILTKKTIVNSKQKLKLKKIAQKLYNDNIISKITAKQQSCLRMILSVGEEQNIQRMDRMRNELMQERDQYMRV